MKFRLDKPIGDLLTDLVREAGRELGARARRVPTRGAQASGPLGGKLAGALRAPESLVKRHRWGAVVDWHALGQTFMWLTQGTRRQVARPVTLAPPQVAIRGAVESEAARYFAKRDRRRAAR